MEELVQQISRVQESELGVKDFQLAVLSALVELLKEQEKLNRTVNMLMKDKKEREREEELYMGDTSDEEMEHRILIPKQYRTDETQTINQTNILYYHESRKAVADDLEVVGDGGDVHAAPDDVVLGQGEYKWKRRVPASKFGKIVKARGQKKDKEFTREIMAIDCK